jgi:hypothetical protein
MKLLYHPDTGNIYPDHCCPHHPLTLRPLTLENCHLGLIVWGRDTITIVRQPNLLIVSDGAQSLVINEFAISVKEFATAFDGVVIVEGKDLCQ